MANPMETMIQKESTTESTPLLSKDLAAEMEKEKSQPFFERPLIRIGVLFFFVYASGVGALYFLEPSWDFLICNYVVTQIITTVGYGEFTVEQEAAKIYMGIYSIVCVMILGYIVQEVIGNVLAAQSLILRRHMRDIEHKFHGNEEMDDDDLKDKYGALNQAIASSVLFFAFLIFGTCFYRMSEHCSCSYGSTFVEGCDESTFEACSTTGGHVKSWSSAFYMSCVTLTTVGFGDFQPRSPTGRMVGCVWMLFGVVTTGNFLAALAGYFFEEASKHKFKAKDLVGEIDDATFETIDKDHSHNISRGEFLAFTLVKYGVVEQCLIEEINELFDKLDAVEPDTQNSVSRDAVRTYQSELSVSTAEAIKKNKSGHLERLSSGIMSFSDAA